MTSPLSPVALVSSHAPKRRAAMPPEAPLSHDGLDAAPDDPPREDESSVVQQQQQQQQQQQ